MTVYDLRNDSPPQGRKEMHMRHRGKFIGFSMKTDDAFSWKIYNDCNQAIGRVDAYIEIKERAVPTIIQKACEGLRDVLAAVILSVLFCSLGLLRGEYEAISPAEFTVMVWVVCGFFSLLKLSVVFAQCREDKSRPWKFYILGYLLGILVGAILFALERNMLLQFTIDGTFRFVFHNVAISTGLVLINKLVFG